MGRVGRYKKVKACDPFAKKRKEKKLRRDYDLPPDEDQTGPLKVGHALRRQERRWAREALGEEEYEMTLFSGERSLPAKKVVLDPRRKNETQKQFERRLKDDSMKLLKEQADKHSSTKQKRKTYLMGKKELKKGVALAKVAASAPVDELALRPEIVVFGERADAPPDLKTKDFSAKLERKVSQKRKGGDRGDEYGSGKRFTKKALKAARERFSAGSRLGNR